MMEGAEDSQRTVFVGNIPYKMTWTLLKKHFSQFGDVNYAKIIFDYVTRKPKGYGFVEFATPEAADRAVGASDAQLECNGRLLRVKLADHVRPNSKRVQSETSSSIVSNSEAPNPEKQVDESDSSEHSQSNVFTDLPDDALILILSYLTALERNRIERVSKRWLKCARAASKLQKHLVIDKCSSPPSFIVFTEKKFHSILKQYSQNLHSLDVSHVSSQLRNKALEIIGSCCKNLKVLDMSGMDCSSKGMKDFTEQCNQLRSVTAKGCLSLNEKGFWYLFHNCKSLESLDCSGNKGITGKCLKQAEHSMKHLRLGGCVNLIDAGLSQLPGRCPNLETLDIDYCEKLTPKTIGAILQSLPLLKEFGSGQIKDTSANPPPRHIIYHIAQPSLLQVLRLFYTGLEDTDLQFICEKCVNLQELDISCNRLTDVSVTQLCSLRHLKILKACHLFNVTDSSLCAVAEQGCLKVLRVQGCKQLSDSFIETLTSSCPDLEEVDIAGASSLTLDSLQHFYRYAARRLQGHLYLYLHGSDFTDDRDLDFPVPPGLTIVTNYRRLYMKTMQWQMEMDQFHPMDQAAGGGGRGGFLVIGGNRNILEPPVNGAPADLYDSDDEFGDYGDDEFLVNDDPLEAERFDPS